MIVGAAIYYFFFPQTYFALYIDSILRNEARIQELTGSSLLRRFLRNHFLDCIWSYAFSNAIYLSNEKKDKSIICFFIPISIGIILELLQVSGRIAGTGDFWDIAVEIVGAAVAVLIIQKREGCNEKI